MDIADKAARREAEFLADALARQARKRHTGHSLSHCEDCGAPIPEGRQKIIPGVRLCVLCQAYQEKGWP